MADDLEASVETFLTDAERVYDEYDDGYIDADVALSRLGDHVADLRDTYESDE